MSPGPSAIRDTAGPDAPGGIAGMGVGGAKRRDQLLELLRASALRRLPEPVQLASGAWSSHFVDGKQALAQWSNLRLAAEAMVESVTAAGHTFDAVGGPTMGADALSVAIAAVSDTRWFFIRRRTKGRGTRRLIEGAQIGPTPKCCWSMTW